MTHAHYRLTSDEFLTINSQLTNAQLRVYLHYKTLDPFGDRRVEICTKAIAETLGMTQRTVQLALNKLSSLGLLIWEKAKSFVRRSVDRLGDLQIAAAKSGSSRRSVDRERQLELCLDAGSEVSQSSSILFNLDHDQEDLQNSEILETSIEEDGEEISVEDALAEIRSAIADNPQGDADYPHDEDLLLNSEDDDSQEFEEILEPETDLQLSTEEAIATGDGRSFRRRVEDFVLKTLGKSPKNRAAYFAKFSKASWQKWEADYRASLISPAPYKPYVPEKVEVAAPDSPVAQSAIAFIKQKLGMK
ncbi:MAG: hypothetical protein NW214_08600 [Pseudanabaenaceae cyanobacterium bins.39]|nr:hypothetical protein [Pseudanabaenaceae cyanobacterium bins.39]